MINYEALSKDLHKSHHFSTPFNFDFARTESTLPVGISELPILSKYVPIIFLKCEDNVFRLRALLSLIPGENNFINEDGIWRLPYVPAILRCHPFKLLSVKNEDGQITDRKILGFIKDSPYVVRNSDSGTSPFFDSDGNHTDRLIKLNQLLSLLENEMAIATQKIQQLFEFDLLTEISTSNTENTEKKTLLRDVFSVNGSKLLECSGESLKTLMSNSTMDLIYHQKFSLINFKNILKNAGATDISTRDAVLQVNKEKKASEINALVQNLLVDD
jgi:hypothetical protein